MRGDTLMVQAKKWVVDLTFVKLLNLNNSNKIKPQTMNRKILMTIAATALSMTCIAEEVPVLSITTDSDSTAISLGDISKVQYSDTEMIVLLNDGAARVFVMDRIRAMAFGSIDDKDMEPMGIALGDKDPDDEGTVFDLSGIKRGNVNKRGVYIIKSGKETRKRLK